MWSGSAAGAACRRALSLGLRRAAANWSTPGPAHRGTALSVEQLGTRSLCVPNELLKGHQPLIYSSRLLQRSRSLCSGFAGAAKQTQTCLLLTASNRHLPQSQKSSRVSWNLRHWQSSSFCGPQPKLFASFCTDFSVRIFVSDSKMAGQPAEVDEGVLLGIGNPLLDVTISANEDFLQKYGLEANNAIIADPEHQPMFDDMMQNYQPRYLAGGATQNTIRVAQWLLGRRNATTFFGSVGIDEKAEILAKKAREEGVCVQYQVIPEASTGVCAAVITGDNRSLVAHLGAAHCFTHEGMRNPDQWALVEKAQCYYIGGFLFPVCTKGIVDIAEHTCDRKKTLVMNLSATYLCKYFVQPSINIMPYVDILFGNEKEAATFCDLQGIQTSDIKEMALQTSKLPKKNTERSRTVIFTQGSDPTIVAKDGEVSEYPIIPVQKEDIKDTNGCGDSFVGGFLSQYVQGKPISECLRCGNYAASVVIKHWGCTFPPHPDFQ